MFKLLSELVSEYVTWRHEVQYLPNFASTEHMDNYKRRSQNKRTREYDLAVPVDQAK